MTEWDILKMDEDAEPGHIQILHRLWDCNIQCLFADMWHTDMAFIVGCDESRQEPIAKALGVHPSSIYNDFEHSFVIINLVEEKLRRGWSVDHILEQGNWAEDY